MAPPPLKKRMLDDGTAQADEPASGLESADPEISQPESKGEPKPECVCLLKRAAKKKIRNEILLDHIISVVHKSHCGKILLAAVGGRALSASNKKYRVSLPATSDERRQAMADMLDTVDRTPTNLKFLCMHVPEHVLESVRQVLEVAVCSTRSHQKCAEAWWRNKVKSGKNYYVVNTLLNEFEDKGHKEVPSNVLDRLNEKRGAKQQVVEGLRAFRVKEAAALAAVEVTSAVSPSTTPQTSDGKSDGEAATTLTGGRTEDASKVRVTHNEPNPTLREVLVLTDNRQRLLSNNVTWNDVSGALKGTPQSKGAMKGGASAAETTPALASVGLSLSAANAHDGVSARNSEELASAAAAPASQSAQQVDAPSALAQQTTPEQHSTARATTRTSRRKRGHDVLDSILTDAEGQEIRKGLQRARGGLIKANGIIADAVPLGALVLGDTDMHEVLGSFSACVGAVRNASIAGTSREKRELRNEAAALLPCLEEAIGNLDRLFFTSKM